MLGQIHRSAYRKLKFVHILHTGVSIYLLETLFLHPSLVSYIYLCLQRTEQSVAMPEPAIRNEKEQPAHKKAMLKSCEAGDLPTLQHIYQAHGIQQGSRLIWSSFETEGGPPPTYELITAAII